jgi:hypothetical protein
MRTVSGQGYTPLQKRLSPNLSFWESSLRFSGKSEPLAASSKAIPKTNRALGMAQKAFVFALLWTASSFSALWGGGILQNFQDAAIAEKQETIYKISERFIPVRFRITERENEKLRAEFRFYSMLTGNPDEINMSAISGEKEISGSRVVFELEGTELFIDTLRIRDTKRIFLFIPTGEINWVFPYRIFTNYMKPDEGRPVFPYYDRDDFPAIYDGLSADILNRELLSLAFTDLKSNGRITDRTLRNRVTGNAVHDIAKFSRYRTGAWYSLAVNMRNGAIEIIEEGL